MRVGPSQFKRSGRLERGCSLTLVRGSRHGPTALKVVNLVIVLKGPIPHVKILSEGRRLKTADSQREIPLVCAAFAAMKKRPQVVPRYRDKSSNLSAGVE